MDNLSELQVDKSLSPSLVVRFSKDEHHATSQIFVDIQLEEVEQFAAQ